MTVVVRVPATSANLGTGFDALGLALGLYNTVTLTPLPDGATDPARAATADESLPVAAYEHVCHAHGIEPLTVHAEVTGDVPSSRGLGSSATCIVGGVLAADALHGLGLGADELVRLATDVEGHPDNVAPALLGGIVVSAVSGGRVHSLPVALPTGGELDLLLAVPAHPVSTEAARAALPAQVPHADAVHNAARSALLVASLATGRLELLGEAMDDRLHQPYRAGLVPGVTEILALARSSGAAGACVSGAGPSLLVVAPGPDTEARLTEHLAGHPWGWQLLRLPLDPTGARVIGPRPA
ncbi:homoserine kinase [Kytococcus sedentarius]|uniref:homoserine kinase n=1 Tax=Kytococcus sedentarius TaxID=1276 RepID=UPI0038798BFF